MLSLNKYIFNIFLFLSIVSQIFLINLSFLGGNIKPSQIFFLLLIFLNIKKLIQFKFPEELVRYGFISLLLILTISFFSFYSYDLQFFLNSPSHEGYDPLIHIILFTFNIFTPLLIYFIMNIYTVKNNFLEIFHDSVFFCTVLFLFFIVGPFDSSFLFKASPEFVLGNEVSVQRFVGGVEYSVIAVAAIISILHSRSFTNNLLFSLFKIFVLLVGIGFGFSRQAILCLLLGLVMAFIMSKRKNLFYLIRISTFSIFIIIAVIYLLFSFYLSAYTELFSERILSIFKTISYFTGTVGDRLQLWSNMIQENSNNIFFGQGMDSYMKFFSFKGEGAHNFPLMIYHSGGIFSLIFYLYIQFSIMLNMINSINKNTIMKPLFIIMSIFIFSSLSNLIYMTHIFWIFIGVSYYYYYKLTP